MDSLVLSVDLCYELLLYLHNCPSTPQINKLIININRFNISFEEPQMMGHLNKLKSVLLREIEAMESNYMLTAIKLQA